MHERYRQFYEMYLGPLPDANSKGEVQVSNPFRHDPNPSLFVNLADGRYNDFGSDLGGDAYNFYMMMQDCTFATAKKAVDQIVGVVEGTFTVSGIALPISDETVQELHTNLMRSEHLKKFLVEERGISIEVIKRRKIGHDGQRFTIPIYNQYGKCVNIRRYLKDAPGSDKMLNWREGYGQARLYPVDALAQKILFLHEGEWDTLLQESESFGAITQTAGAGTWFSEWTPVFKDKIVYICYDCDEAGRKGAQKVATHLSGVASEVRILTLPLSGSKDDKDITDFYLRHQKTASDFMELLPTAELFTLSTEDKEKAGLAIPVSLIEARQSQYKHKRVQFDVMIVGKDTAPYNIPANIKFKCGMVGINDRLCGQCQVGRMGGEYSLRISQDPDVLELIRATKQQQLGLIKKKAGIPSTCSMFQADDQISVNIEEILLAPEITSFAEWDGESNNYLIQSAYFVSSAVEANRSYRMRGVMTPDPWTQHVTFLLDEAEPLQDNISSFRMVPELRDRLKIFQTNDIPSKFNEIHSDFEHNITHIIGRNDLLAAIDLCYHSVIGFNFQGVPVQKGWVEFLCMGDTRTGKSETVTKMLQHYQLGEISVAENTSFAGLVGGLQQTGDRRWFLTWGKLPLNDGRLFVIDEASGLSVEDIARMSGIRSSGIAEVTKIQTERTTARVRTIWLSNPRSGNHLGSYNYGIQSVPELIGKTEDISRFDYVISVSRDEVPLEEINCRVNPNKHVEQKYHSELCKDLILWCWSRTPNDIIFETEAVDAILKYAIIQGKTYSAKIPLVEGANQRIKLAKLAVATAARVFSTDDSGEKIIVKEAHVEFAYQFLEEVYSKPSLDYKGYSERELGDYRLAMEKQEEVFVYLNAFPEVGELLDRQDFILPRHFEEQLGLIRETSQEHIAFFNRTRMLVEASNRGYRKTSACISILRRWKLSRNEKEL